MPRATALLLVCLLTLLTAAEARADDLTQARAALYASYAARLDELAAECQKQGDSEAAQTLQTWLPRREPGRLTLFVLPSAAAPGNEKSQTAEWRSTWQTLRDQQAAALVSLAQRAAEEHHPSLAAELITEAVRENPDHKQARRILGYVRFRDGWHAPFEARQLNAGKVWTDQFGWLPQAHVERYRQGQRYYRGRWMPAAEEAALRSDIKRGWRVDSEHYSVTTNHSLEAGVRLSRRLERLHAVWQQVFFPFVVDDADLARRFAGRGPRREAKPHDVVYFRTHQEYNDTLRSVEAKIDITLGIYFDKLRTAYFFAGGDQEPGTVYHEATHQLFHETREVAGDVGRKDNFWILEGIACYMESLADEGAWCTLGGPSAGRMPAARQRLIADQFYVPLDELVRIGMDDWQRDSRMAPLYSQSAGLADFLMHDVEGRYRDTLVRYLMAIYSGRAAPQTLAELSGTSYATLDRQYRDFMSRDEPAAAAPGSAAR